MRLIATAAAAAVALSLTTGTAFAKCDAGEIVIKFSHVTNTDKHPKGIAASLLEKRVNEEMNGKACMEVFPNSQLYNDNTVLEAMLAGDVQMAAPSLSKFEKFTKKFRLFDLPFMFNDINAVDSFQNSADGQKLKASMKRRGLLGLAFWHNGMKQISANKPLITPADAKGLKFRVQASDVLVAQMAALDANPQKMAFSEVYGALQTGVVDGQENTWSNIYGKKFFEVQDGVTESNHGIIDYLVVTSTKWWDSLPGDVRSQLQKIMDEVTATRNAESTKVNEEAKQAIIAAGGVVRQLNADQRAKWVETMKPVWGPHSRTTSSKLLGALCRGAVRVTGPRLPLTTIRNHGPGGRVMHYEPTSALGRVVNEIEETMIALILGVMTIITFVNVIARYVFNDNILWALETTVFLFAWLVLLGASYCVKTHSHLGVDAVINIVSTKTRKILAGISITATLAFCVLLMIGAWNFWAPFAALPMTNGEINDQAWYEVDDIPMLDWLRFIEASMNEGEAYEKLPRFIPYAALPIGMALLTFRVLQAAWHFATGRIDTIIAGHEAEEMVEEATQQTKQEG
jgi:C4-dicarboxylate-binding protein DctP